MYKLVCLLDIFLNIVLTYNIITNLYIIEYLLLNVIYGLF